MCGPGTSSNNIAWDALEMQALRPILLLLLLSRFSRVRLSDPVPMHTTWPALQFGGCRTTPHILCLILALDKLNVISFFTLLPFSQKKFKFSEVTYLNPQSIPCFSKSQPRSHVCFYLSRPPSPIFPPFFPVMSTFHIVFSVEQDLLLIVIGCSGGTVAFIEGLFVMPPWRELHSMCSFIFCQIRSFDFLSGQTR